MQLHGQYFPEKPVVSTLIHVIYLLVDKQCTAGSRGASKMMNLQTFCSVVFANFEKVTVKIRFMLLLIIQWLLTGLKQLIITKYIVSCFIVKPCWNHADKLSKFSRKCMFVCFFCLNKLCDPWVFTKAWRMIQNISHICKSLFLKGPINIWVKKKKVLRIIWWFRLYRVLSQTR